MAFDKKLSIEDIIYILKIDRRQGRHKRRVLLKIKTINMSAFSHQLLIFIPKTNKRAVN
jgi:hypothetical protein